MREGYETYQFRIALSAIVEFCNVDLSAFYVDVRKDALYCDPPTSARRRACRAALNETFLRLAIWLAPLMPFTAEEAWLTRYPNEVSVHLRQFLETPEAWRDAGSYKQLEFVRSIRRVVTGALEISRAERKIGSSLEAKVVVFDTNMGAEFNVADLAQKNGSASAEDFLSELFITSGAEWRSGEEGPQNAFRLMDDSRNISVIVEKASGAKCARSWKYFDPATANPRFPDINPRDAEAVIAWDAAHGR